MIVNLSDCGVAGEALSGPRQELALYNKTNKKNNSKPVQAQNQKNEKLILKISFVR